MAKILMVAGEASADRHAAQVIKSLKNILPGVEIFGMGGPEMRSAGMECVYTMDEISVMGFSGVVPRLSRILAVMSGIKHLIKERNPDIFIPVDLPDFNMRLAKFAKAKKVKVLYYIAPQAWAWRKGRAKTLAKTTDGLAVIFPFEEKFFQSYGVNARYVGHPFLQEERKTIKAKWPPQRIAIMPGSRSHEVQEILPIMQGAKRILQKDYPSISWYLPMAKGLPKKLFEELVDSDVGLTESIPEVDLAMVKSGTSTFEMALSGVPEVICYKTSSLNYYLAKAFIGIDQIGMPNIVSGVPIVPELIQDQFTKQGLVLELRRYIEDESLYNSTQDAFIKLCSSMGSQKASEEVARWVRSMITM